MTRLGEQALILATNGYHVFPLAARAKRPITERGFKAATRDAQRIAEWWQRSPDANVGVACGESGIVVFDIDPRAGGNPQVILAEQDRAGAAVVATGVAPERSEHYPLSLTGYRGLHVYFRGEMPNTPRLAIVGCEIKGAGGYVVAPGSIHPCGVEYVGDLPSVCELPPVPDWLLGLVPQRPERPALVRRAPRLATDDPLRGIPAEEYIPALTGREIGRDRKVQCPFHAGGLERTPSLHVYPGDGGWYCWPCGAGGDIYSFGELFYGIEARGASFHELRRRLAEELLGAAA